METVVKIDEAVNTITGFLRTFLKERKYFYPELSALEPGVTLAPLIFGLAYETGPEEITVILTLDRALDSETPDPVARACVDESMKALRAAHPELGGYALKTRIK